MIGNYTIDDIDNELEAMLHGTTLNQITNRYGAYNRAARRLLGDVNPQETKVVEQFGKLYDDVFEYPLADWIKGNTQIDFFPQANRSMRDNFSQKYNKDFDLWKSFSLTPIFTPRYSSGVRTIRISAPNVQNGILLNAADGTNTNGLWTAVSSATNLQNNNLYFTDNSYGSISVTLPAGGSSGGFVNSTSSSVDLTNNYINGDLFLWVYLPNASVFTSVDLAFGSSASNYYHKTETVDSQGNAFVNGWNLIAFAWADATVVGSPNYTNITYQKVLFNYNGTLQTQVCISQIWNRLGAIYNIEAYSKYLFRDGTTNAFKEKVTAQSDIINLDTDGLNMFLYACGCELVQQQQGLDATFADAPDFESKYTQEVFNYKQKYKSENLKPQSTYYGTPRATYRKYMGRGYRTP